MVERTDKRFYHSWLLAYRHYRKHWENPFWRHNMSNITSKFGSGISAVYHMQKFIIGAPSRRSSPRPARSAILPRKPCGEVDGGYAARSLLPCAYPRS